MSLPRVIFHLDLDAFFAAAEQLDNPPYRGKPVIVGSLPGERGVVATCSYEARVYGVRSALPISRAYELCPQGIYVRPRMERYLELSSQVMGILGDFSPEVRRVSVDEAFLDMTGSGTLFGPPVQAAQKLKDRIRDRVGLSCSVGIAPNHYVAKLASDFKKPDGLYMVPQEAVQDFMDLLPLGKLHGVGASTLRRLEELGINTVVQLRSHPLVVLQQLLGQAAGQFLFNASRGLESHDYGAQPKSRSLSTERTFQEDMTGVEPVRLTFLEMAQECTFRSFSENWRSRTVQVKLRFQDFSMTTVQKTLDHYLASSEELFKEAWNLVRNKWNGRPPLRLVGLGLSNLQAAGALEQNELFDDADQKSRRVEQAVLGLKKKYPKAGLVRAGLLKKDDSSNDTI